MNDSSLVAGCLALAIALAGLVSAVTESLAVFGSTPVGVGIYLAVGIGLPQYLLYRDGGSPVELGLATLAVASAALAVLLGLVRGAPHGDWGLGLVTILLFVVLGNLLGTIVREFRAGFRSDM